MKKTRRQVFQAGGIAAAGLLTPAAAAPPEPTKLPSDNVYTRIGLQPFINMTATYTINGGAPMLPEVRQAMDEAALFAVNLDELTEKAGARIAQLLQAEAAMVSCGCAAALVHGTAACLAGGDPEKMKQLPDTTGLKNEVLIARQSRNDYDHAYRVPGAKLIEFDTREEFLAALGHRTAMVAVLGTGEAKAKIRLEEIVAEAHKFNVPVIVDAAAELPLRPNPYLSRGADLVAYSGGKILRGPQSAGLLLGRKDLIRSAWTNSAPHHAFGRALKVSKEEVIGMLTAVELFVGKRKMEEEYRVWESWYRTISDEITKIPGVTTKIMPPAGASPFPVMNVAWDPQKVGLNGDEVYDKLLNGSPRIMSHAGGEATSFVIRGVAMRPEHPPIVARRLAEIFRSAPTSRSSKSEQPPSASLAGSWDVEIQFSSGKARHTLLFDPPGAKASAVRGTHVGKTARARLNGTILGDQVSFKSSLPVEGMHLRYSFSGKINGDSIAGDVDLGEFGRARFSARRVTA